MLILGRKVGERIVIDDGRIIVMVRAIYGREVKLGIEAPEGVRIEREEVAERRYNRSPERHRLGP